MMASDLSTSAKDPNSWNARDMRLIKIKNEKKGSKEVLLLPRCTKVFDSFSPKMHIHCS